MLAFILLAFILVLIRLFSDLLKEGDFHYCLFANGFLLLLTLILRTFFLLAFVYGAHRTLALIALILFAFVLFAFVLFTFVLILVLIRLLLFYHAFGELELQ